MYLECGMLLLYAARTSLHVSRESPSTTPDTTGNTTDTSRSMKKVMNVQRLKMTILATMRRICVVSQGSSSRLLWRMMAGTRRLVKRNSRLRSTEEVWGSETSSRKTVTLLVMEESHCWLTTQCARLVTRLVHTGRVRRARVR